MVETKEISELTRSNRIAMLSHISTVTVMVFFMIWESVRGQLSPVYMTIATVVGVIPLIGEVICWKGNTEHAMIKHLVSYGFALFYTICLFTSPTNLIYVFVIPMIFVVTIYSDTRYLLLINTGTILESIIVVVIGATKGGFGYHGIEAAVVQIVVMIMVGANSVLTTKVIRENTRKRFTEVAQAKAEAENLLERNEELDQQISGNIADINVRFEKLTAASKTTTEAMQEVSAGATDTAEHVQNQLEQTHAIQDKVDEVATAVENTRKRFTEVAVAVEEIGNSMTLTLKALAEGKQDIEHLASEVEASVDNGTEVTEKLENLNQYMDEMNSIVELIGGITNQTSLLALNASIEAARAGEAGRGFSVVATEISGMATRTKEATVHITELISNVSNAIMEVVGVVSNMIDGINEEKTGASNAEESFESIEDNTRAIQKNADTLSRSISELQNANKEIIDSIQTISAISQQVSAHAGETMQAEEENLNVMQDVSAIMQKLATLATH